MLYNCEYFFYLPSQFLFPKSKCLSTALGSTQSSLSLAQRQRATGGRSGGNVTAEEVSLFTGGTTSQSNRKHL